MQLSIKKASNPIKKWVENVNRHFCKEDRQMADKYIQGCSTSLILAAAAAAAAKSLQSGLNLCDPIYSSPLGSSVPRILQVRILEWVAIYFSNACMNAKSLQL